MKKLKRLELSPQNFRYDVLHLLYSDLNHYFFSKGGGSRGSSSRGSYSRGSYSRGSSSRGSGLSRSAYNQKKKSKSVSTLKKAAVIGVGAYVGYKATKGAAKLFKKAFQGPDFDGPDFDTWNRWRQVDGILCITNSHCNWIDPNFECQRVGSFGWNLSPDVSFIDFNACLTEKVWVKMGVA